MKAKLIVEGKEFEVTINHPELEKLIKSQKKTGYERLGKYSNYYAVYGNSMVVGHSETGNDMDDAYYNDANYYSDNLLAEDNARADKLMRQLRRFAVEHRENKIDWNTQTKKYVIRYSYAEHVFLCPYEVLGRDAGCIAFDSEEITKLAIDTFHDELIWYFTEYKDSL